MSQDFDEQLCSFAYCIAQMCLMPLCKNRRDNLICRWHALCSSSNHSAIKQRNLQQSHPLTIPIEYSWDEVTKVTKVESKVEECRLVGAFFLMCKDLGRLFNNSFPACAFLFFFEIRLHMLIPLFRPGSVYSGSCSASWDGCGQAFSDKLHVSSFPERFPH